MDAVGARTAANAMSPFLAVRSSQPEAQSVSGSFSSFAKAHVAAAEGSAAARRFLPLAALHARFVSLPAGKTPPCGLRRGAADSAFKAVRVFSLFFLSDFVKENMKAVYNRPSFA